MNDNEMQMIHYDLQNLGQVIREIRELEEMNRNAAKQHEDTANQLAQSAHELASLQK